MSWISDMFRRPSPPAVSRSRGNTDLRLASIFQGAIAPATWDGEKFPGGFGDTLIYAPDHYYLRARSAQLFQDNLYARGLIRRLVTNVINVGLALESTPVTSRIPLPWDDQQWTDWTEAVEVLFATWGSQARLCDYQQRLTWGQLQQTIYREALVDGDILVTLMSGPDGAPRIRLIPGSAVCSPYNGPNPREGHKINMGVEIDPQGRHVAYWIREGEQKYKRLPAWGEKSGRRLAWLVYGTDKRFKDVRGLPMLQLIMQSLRDMDRTRDAVQRKALLNSIMAMFVEKTSDRMGSGALTGVATRRDSIQADGHDGETRNFNISKLIPGAFIETLQQGETIKAFDSTGTDHKFSEFEAAVIAGLAWAHEVPPEVLTLAFRQNYSASRAVLNELKSFLTRERGDFASNVTEPVYREFLIAMVAAGKVPAPGFLAAYRNPAAWDLAEAWLANEFCGVVKPSVDPLKDLQAYGLMLQSGMITHDRATRETSGMKFSRVIPRLRKENELLKWALEPLGGFNPSGASQPVSEEPVDEREQEE